MGRDNTQIRALAQHRAVRCPAARVDGIEQASILVVGSLRDRSAPTQLPIAGARPDLDPASRATSAA
jgi:hypothetical protein